MKKIMVAMLLILPLIIVACVLLSTSIISTTAYIAVERVALDVDTEKTLELPLSKGSYQLKATVFPTGATNKDVVWTIENMQCFGDETKYPVPASVDDKGKVTFLTYCTFDVVVTTVEGSKTARVNFYIKGDKLESVRIADEESTVMTGQSVELNAVCSPLDADVEGVSWVSDNPAVLSVDNNGIITGKSTGEATVTVTVAEGISAVKTFSVVRGATKYGTAFSVSRNFNLDEIDPEGATTVLSGGTLTGRDFVFDGDTAVLNVGGRSVTVTKCAADEIAVQNADKLNGRLLRVGKLPVYLTAVYKDVFNTAVPEVNFVSSDPTVAKVEGGKVVALKKGDFTVSAESNVLSFTSVIPVNYIRLNKIDGDDVRGIAASTVYGNTSYADGSLTAFRYELKIQYPSESDWEDFTIETDKPDLVDVEGHTLVFKEGVTERTKVKVIVGAKYSAYESMDVKTVRNLEIVNGINCVSYAEMQAASLTDKAVVMRNNVSLSGGDGTLNISTALYGNAYIIDAVGMAKSDAKKPIIKVCAGGVKIINAHVRCDNAEKINQANGMSGVAVSIGEKDQPTRYEDVLLQYSIFENGYYALECRNCSVTVDGCILRNTSNFGIEIYSSYNNELTFEEGDPLYAYGNNDWSDVKLNNCVMSNIVATAIGMSSEANNDRFSSLHSTGFLDIYNWQDITSARMLDRELIPDNPRLNEVLSSLIKNALKSELQNAQYDSIRYTVTEGRKTIDYIHLGVVSAGAIQPPATDITFEDGRMKTFPLDRVVAMGKTVGVTLDPIVLYLYDNNADITPSSTFSETAKLYKELREGRK